MLKTAVLLVNLGTPGAPTPAAVRRYLSEFLSDRRVIDLPRWKWLPILHGIILRVRPRKTAALYRQIWTSEGSPLLMNCLIQRSGLQKRLAADKIKVALGMSYGSPALRGELEQLHRWGVRHLIILPLYPQYSSTTVASVWDGCANVLAGWPDLPELSFITNYATHPLYIEALTERIQTEIRQNGKPDCLLLSYHGIPQQYADSGDPYAQHCLATTGALQKRLSDLKIIQSYQSRFGHEKWLEPDTLETVTSLAHQGIRHLAVMAPGFTSDCVETLYELAIENAAAFKKAGGESFHYIPALNDSSTFTACLEKLVRSRIHSDV
ncbi:ferrochelatase [Sporolactobacillus sp. CQH2019]|uniref:ferrochelatase n=1 Tax=Sporolactobacillus sp. CQH2019 TaxID=3023512 RepID=UPI0023688CAC|nr:ferrochelatase [Sporolactobacillus sp. CQH2019]MDD9147794.1 ferrochelatase [Sporolactobacillus sp. CQH2019]